MVSHLNRGTSAITVFGHQITLLEKDAKMTKLYYANPSRTLFRPLALLYLAMVLVLGSIAYGYASSAVLDPSMAGEGQQAISGFNVQNINHLLSPADPAKIAAVQFEINSSDAAAGNVYVAVNENAKLTSCEHTSGYTWVCEFMPGNQPTVAEISSLRVIASE
jgi:hypothetical protein